MSYPAIERHVAAHIPQRACVHALLGALHKSMRKGYSSLREAGPVYGALCHATLLRAECLPDAQ